MNERVKAWMESLSPDVKAKASSIRRCILSYDSHINEGWSYGMPSYKIKKTFFILMCIKDILDYILIIKQ